MTSSDYTTPNQAINVCLGIILKARQEIPGVNVDMRLSECSETKGDISVYFRSAKQDYFPIPRLDIMMSQYEKDKMAIEIYGSISASDFDNPDASYFSADAISRLSENLRPFITESLLHRSPDPILERDKTGRMVNRQLEVKFRIYDELLEAEEESLTFDIDVEKIANTALPYVKALVNIRSKLKGVNGGKRL